MIGCSLTLRRILPRVLNNQKKFTILHRQTCIMLHNVRTQLLSTGIDWSDNEFKDIVSKNNLVVFMKGTPDAPQCGFSKYVIQIFHMHGVEKFKTFDVLADEILRQRVKEFSNWPTIPQVYMNSEFVGGFDILLQLHQSGELVEELDKIGHKSTLIEKEDNESK